MVRGGQGCLYLLFHGKQLESMRMYREEGNGVGWGDSCSQDYSKESKHSEARVLFIRRKRMGCEELKALWPQEMFSVKIGLDIRLLT